MSDNDRSSPPPAAAANDTVDPALVELTASFSNEQHATPQPSPAMDRWGALECRRKIAGGSFGTVSLAWDPVLEREVALKVLRAAGRSQERLGPGSGGASVEREGASTMRGNGFPTGTLTVTWNGP